MIAQSRLLLEQLEWVDPETVGYSNARGVISLPFSPGSIARPLTW